MYSEIALKIKVRSRWVLRGHTMCPSGTKNVVKLAESILENLLWMFQENEINDKVNKLHQRVLRIVYNDTVASFWLKLKIFTIHRQNIQSLAIEIYKAIHNLPGGNLSNSFVRNNHNYNLRSESELLLPNVNTLLKVQTSISCFGSVIWNSIPFESCKLLWNF